jgi:hypothetical protein
MQEVLYRRQARGGVAKQIGEDPESRNFSAKQSVTGARQKTTKQALNTVEADRVKNRGGKILTDCSDSQIAEDLESVSTAQGCKAHARAPW